MKTDIEEDEIPSEDKSEGDGSDTTNSDGESEDMESSDKSKGDVKVPEDFQRRAIALVQSCETLPCLDFLSSEVSDARHKLMSSQKKSGLEKNMFSTEGMPD